MSNKDKKMTRSIDAQNLVSRYFADKSFGLPQQKFDRLAKLTALRCTKEGQFYYSNLYRGHLLYTLVQKHRPKTILEIGTGRGYGALSMALAALDAKLETQIYSVDVIPSHSAQKWAIDDGSGPQIKNLSLWEVWAQFPVAWTERIHLLTGTSVDCMRHWLADPSSPTIDFAFIDGGHDYWTARHDIAAALLVHSQV